MRIINLQLNRHFLALGKLLHLKEAGLVHLLYLDKVFEELLPLGGHLVVEHIPGLLLHASKPTQLLHTRPSLLGWQTVSSWQVPEGPES